MIMIMLNMKNSKLNIIIIKIIKELILMLQIEMNQIVLHIIINLQQKVLYQKVIV